jgi:peptide/nickel transport system permease protein
MKYWPLWILSGIFVLSMLAPLVAPFDPMQTNVDKVMQPPSTEHLLGTDTLGRDVWSRVLYGGQLTLTITSLSTALAVVSGTCLGLLAGLSGKTGNYWFTILMNALLAFPGLLLALVIVTILGTGSGSIILATGLAQTVLFARITRAAVLEVRSSLYIESARMIGSTTRRIVVLYILPNILSTLATYKAVTFSYCLLNSAALSFLGLGGEPGIPDWGVMLAEGRMVFRTAPWIAFAPGIAITLVVCSINAWSSRIGVLNT